MIKRVYNEKEVKSIIENIVNKREMEENQPPEMQNYSIKEAKNVVMFFLELAEKSQELEKVLFKTLSTMATENLLSISLGRAPIYDYLPTVLDDELKNKFNK